MRAVEQSVLTRGDPSETYKKCCTKRSDHARQACLHHPSQPDSMAILEEQHHTASDKNNIHGGAGKLAILNSLIGHPVLPTGEQGATRARAPISFDLHRDESLNNKSIVLQIENKSQQVSATPPLKLIDFPGLDQRKMDDALISNYVEQNDAILLVTIPASQAPNFLSSQALKLAKEYDAEGTRTIGVISNIHKVASDQMILTVD
ncbi:hypothetical protein GIB67_025091 [Kingdonia uniflora]|uniref:Dynamin N-terminal domain-containing protein n=1 Tax=Kingdonia uniflora TaxID=39325 RepID=A0A7J7N7X0_9MAGN|nr:hypothetical protein GIB67_025091 [Kingdonia uniflora]